MIYAEAFVCGNQGAVVGEYPRTSDYWQGDERKFTNCFQGGVGRLYVGDLKFDESTQSNAIQISVPVMDGEEFVAKLKDLGIIESIPVVIVSSAGSDRMASFFTAGRNRSKGTYSILSFSGGCSRILVRTEKTQTCSG